jgi:hypothetical protein
VSNEPRNFISLIYNYCDSWCDRCAFTNRCRVFAETATFSEEEKDINNEKFWRRLAASFAEAKRLLTEKAVELGIDLDSISDEEFATMRKREGEFLGSEELPKLAKDYSFATKEAIERVDDWINFAPLEDDLRKEMLEIIQWYQYFIAAKIHRALSGLLDFDSEFDEEEISDPQSDANGSAKIALIATERSIMAWTSLVSEQNSQQIAFLISMLQTIKRNLQEKFPKARDFVRPGFDEVEGVM